MLPAWPRWYAGCTAAGRKCIRWRCAPIARFRAADLSWWWELLPLLMMSTPFSADAMCGASGVKSSSHVSHAIVASLRESIKSPASHRSQCLPVEQPIQRTHGAYRHGRGGQQRSKHHRTYGTGCLSAQWLQRQWQIKLLCLSHMLPRRKIPPLSARPQLPVTARSPDVSAGAASSARHHVPSQRSGPVVAIIRKVLLGSDGQDAPVQQEDPAVVPRPTVHDRHANVTHDAAGGLALQQLLQPSTHRATRPVPGWILHSWE